MISENSQGEHNPRRAAETRRGASLMRRILIGFKAQLEEELRSKNLTASQWRLLHELREMPGSSGAQLARACHVTPQSAQAMLVRAVKHGWVVRGKDSHNERVVTVRLTPAGERLLTYADQVLARVEAEVWAGVAIADLRAMNAILERGLVNLEHESAD